MPLSLQRYSRRVDALTLGTRTGRVVEARGLVLEAIGPHACLGELCELRIGRDPAPARHRRATLDDWIQERPRPVAAEVVGFRGDRALLMPLGDLTGVKPGSEVVATGQPLSVGVGDELLGRVIDGLGRPMDGLGEPLCRERRAVTGRPPEPLSRKPITEPLATRVRAVDAFLTVGRGQRVGIFAGSGVGKSTLLAKIARHSEADVNVIALIGERNREVGEFIHRSLGEDGLTRSVVVVATSNTPALWRAKGALVATTIAEYFRDQGKHVLLVVDSVTRFALALREIGMSVGEPAASRGYTASVFAALPQFMERAGTGPQGSITALYTVLVEGDDLDEPISDAVRAILDGHVVLSRDMSNQGHYPPIDILQSLSRLMPDVVDAQHQADAQALRSVYATYRQAEDMINIGAYVEGRNPKVDCAIKLIEPLHAFLRQELHEEPELAATVGQMRQLAEVAERLSIVNVHRAEDARAQGAQGP